MTDAPVRRASQQFEPRFVWGLLRTSLIAWSAITLSLTIYVLGAYPSEASGWAVLGRQIANWMPFSLALPAMHLGVRWLGPDPTRSRRLVWGIAAGIATVLAYSLIRFFALLLLAPSLRAPHETWGEELTRMWPIAAIVYAVLLSVLFGMHARHGREQAERAAQRLEAELARAQLRALQSQIRPHFLFNTLQAIEDACWRDPATASRMILMLSDLLRASLQRERAPTKTLADDVELARKYMAIQEVRFGARLTFTADVDPALHSLPFPTMWLQPLLENAIAHGIESLPEGGAVQLSVRRSGDELAIEIGNDGPSTTDLRAGEPPRFEGIGLANTAARWQSMFGPDATMEIKPRAGGGAALIARAPLRKKP